MSYSIGLIDKELGKTLSRARNSPVTPQPNPGILTANALEGEARAVPRAYCPGLGFVFVVSISLYIYIYGVGIRAVDFLDPSWLI